MRILLAEDATLLREGLVALLERAGHSVVAVANATELDHRGRSLAARDEIDLVLTDVRMPPGDSDDGLRVAVGLRADHPGLPLGDRTGPTRARQHRRTGSAVGHHVADRVDQHRADPRPCRRRRVPLHRGYHPRGG